MTTLTFNGITHNVDDNEFTYVNFTNPFALMKLTVLGHKVVLSQHVEIDDSVWTYTDMSIDGYEIENVAEFLSAVSPEGVHSDTPELDAWMDATRTCLSRSHHDGKLKPAIEGVINKLLTQQAVAA